MHTRCPDELALLLASQRRSIGSVDAESASPHLCQGQQGVPEEAAPNRLLLDTLRVMTVSCMQALVEESARQQKAQQDQRQEQERQRLQQAMIQVPQSYLALLNHIPHTNLCLPT